MDLFRFLGSRHIRSDPLGFSTMTCELTHSVGSDTGAMMPISNIQLISSLRRLFSATGTLRQASMTAEIVGSINI